MENYYLHDGTERTGPFSLEELNAKNIGENQMVWTEGMKDWTPIGKIPALAAFLKKTPPAFHKLTPTEKASNTVGRYLLTSITVVTLFIVGYMFFGYRAKPARPRFNAFRKSFSTRNLSSFSSISWTRI